jgi:hypothetical protein
MMGLLLLLSLESLLATWFTRTPAEVPPAVKPETPAAQPEEEKVTT